MDIQFRHLLFVLILFGFAACDVDFGSQESGEDQNVAPAIESTAVTHKDVLLTNVDQLRMRRYGNTKSEMITTLDENTPLIFTGEQTDYEETIGGQRGAWKRVHTLDKEYEGWVFGATHFVSPWLSAAEIQEMESSGKRIEFFSNLTKKEMAELTGANFDESVRGTRFSGYYPYDLGGSNDVINGTVKIRAREFDSRGQEVSFVPCEMTIVDGMPQTTLDCIREESE